MHSETQPPLNLSGVVSSQAHKTKSHKPDMHTLNKRTCIMNQKIKTK